ncbi:unnamed protein product, partial [Brenthis ino]
MNIVSLILSNLPTVLLSKWSDYSFPLITEGKKSRLDILADFLQEEAVKISTTSNIHLIGNNFNRVHNTVLVTTDNHDFKCLYCRVSKHKLTECKRFKKSLRKDRWRHVKRHGICYKCLLSRHDRETCPAAPCDIENCGQSHHRLLHYPITKDIRSPGNINITEITESATVTNINLSNCKVFLKTVPINIHGPNGVISATALLDDGSTVSLIDYELVKKLGLNGHKQIMRVSGAWNNNSLECVCEIVDLSVSNKDGTMFPIRVRSVKDLNLPVHDSTSIDLTNYVHSIPDIKNCLNNELCKPKILIGQDNYDLLLPLKIIKLKNSKLYVTRTELGLCIHGCLREPSPLHQTPPIKRVHHSALFITNDSDKEYENKLRNLEEQIRISFTIESMGISMRPRKNPEDLQAIQYLEKTSVLKNGRWHVGLPWKDNNCGFEIRNITSNNEAVLNCIPQETLGTTAVRFKIEQPNEGERTLGLIWYPKEDLLSFDVSFKKIPVDIITGDTRPSKRQMLKVLMSIFDIFGFLSPFTIKGKIMLQDVWRLQLDWDEKIPDTIYEKWIEWLQLLKEINQLRIPRHYVTAARVNETELRCTSDAITHTSPERPPLPVSCISESLACASNGQITSSFVAHRLGEIDELSKPNEWRYIPTKLNSADIATKETCDLSVLKNEWFYGPAFLRDRDTEWPVDTQLPETPHLDLEYTMTMQTYNKSLPAVPDPERPRKTASTSSLTDTYRFDRMDHYTQKTEKKEDGWDLTAKPNRLLVEQNR